jgi:hypothetical protein
MPSPSSAEEALQRGWAYEQEFAQIGGEAPNGFNELTPADYEAKAIPQGIREAVEDVAGFDLTNTWSGDVHAQSVVVAGAARLDWPSQGGVIVFDSAGQSPFIPTPVESGAVRIENARGIVLTLVAEDDTRFTFDIVSRVIAFRR